MPVLRTVFFCALLAAPAQGEPAKPSLPPALVDIAGNTHNLGADKNTKLAVFVYVSTDCPIANFFQPTLRKLAKKFDAQGVRFFQVHADPDLTTKAATKHAREFNVISPVILDSKQQWARHHRAKVTPEAIVVLPNGTCVYRGRIDDTYTAFGKRRPEPTSRDLDAAITATLAGKQVVTPVTKAIGCQIFIED